MKWPRDSPTRRHPDTKKGLNHRTKSRFFSMIPTWLVDWWCTPTNVKFHVECSYTRIFSKIQRAKRETKMLTILEFLTRRSLLPVRTVDTVTVQHYWLYYTELHYTTLDYPLDYPLSQQQQQWQIQIQQQIQTQTQINNLERGEPCKRHFQIQHWFSPYSFSRVRLLQLF